MTRIITDFIVPEPAPVTSIANPKVKLVRALQSQRKARQRERRFVIEGVRLVEEAIRAGAKAEDLIRVDFVLFTAEAGENDRARAALEALTAAGATTVEVSREVMEYCSDTETPQSLLAVLPFPKPRGEPLPSLVLIVDRLSDPGNLGTILRTAQAAWVDRVYLSPGTVDAYNPKVVRSAMGAHFHLPIVSAPWPKIAEEASHWKLAPWLATSRQGAEYDKVDWTRPAALIVGGEAEGASPEAEALAPHRVRIPMPGGGESLNAAVAAGVLMYEVLRQRRGI